MTSEDERSRSEELRNLRLELAALEAERGSFSHSEPLASTDEVGGIGATASSERLGLPEEMRHIKDRIAALEVEGAQAED